MCSFDQSLNENPRTLKYIMILMGYDSAGVYVRQMLQNRAGFATTPKENLAQMPSG
jgi:hypothetical protein